MDGFTPNLGMALADMINCDIFFDDVEQCRFCGGHSDNTVCAVTE